MIKAEGPGVIFFIYLFSLGIKCCERTSLALVYHSGQGPRLAQRFELGKGCSKVFSSLVPPFLVHMRVDFDIMKRIDR